MSYTIDIIHVPVPPDDRRAWEFLQELRDACYDDERPLPPVVQQLHDRLTARFPCITKDPSGPWSDGPLINNFKHDLTILGMSFSRVEEVLPFVISTALELGFVVFDGQDERFHRPGLPPGEPLALDAE